MLCFDKLLRKDTYWADHNAEVTSASIVSHLVAKLMHFSKKYIPTLKSTAWNYPKFHWKWAAQLSLQFFVSCYTSHSHPSTSVVLQFILEVLLLSVGAQPDVLVAENCSRDFQLIYLWVRFVNSTTRQQARSTSTLLQGGQQGVEAYHFMTCQWCVRRMGVRSWQQKLQMTPPSIARKGLHHRLLATIWV